MHNKKRFLDRVKAYKLGTQIVIAVILFAVFVLSLLLYCLPDIRNNEIAGNLLLALFTSLLVSVITLVADIIVEFKKHKNETYLENLREFGIGNLYRNKEEVLREFLQECDRQIWVSGYRLILTRNLKKDIYDAMKRGADFKALICPPWTDAFKLVYGSNEKVLDNYLQIFHLVNKARKETGKDEKLVEVVFVDKPIFSDTYRVDQKLVTGPYMHNKDEEYNILMAKDFFSYDIVRQSDLSKLINDEYETLYAEAKTKLNWTKFEEAYEKVIRGDMCEALKIEALRAACEDIPMAGTV